MLSFFPRGVLDEILNLIESVFEDFPSYSYKCVHLPFERIYLIMSPGPFFSSIFLIASIVGKSGFRGISAFLVFCYIDK